MVSITLPTLRHPSHRVNSRSRSQVEVVEQAQSAAAVVMKHRNVVSFSIAPGQVSALRYVDTE